jgi:hypothetical protein
MKTIVRNELGTTLVATLILLLALFASTTAGLMAATSSAQISGNYRTGTQALLLAETGVVHSVKKLSDEGIRRLDNEVVAVWETVFGSGVKTMAGYDGYEYRVTAATVASDPLSRMELTSTGEAPPASLRRIEALLELDGAFSPGAIYLPGSSVDTDFNGNQFLVDGHDRAIIATVPPYTDLEDRPGIALKNNANVATVLATLNNGQYDNVEGAGGSPSVLPADGPSTSRIENDIAGAILARPGVVTNPIILGNATFGTVYPLLVPQITHFTSSVTLSGTVEGAGILIVDGGLTINGNFDFVGLIIVRGPTVFTRHADETETTVTGNSSIVGALWTTDLNLEVGGSASVTYSSQALELMNATFGGNVLIQDVKLAAWKEL